ncbi:MAG: hypothetical protein FJW29_02115 [Acidobacteria bacterium]|nr:hypothetical protein [Acidobacteriota bacterium]
MIDWQMIGVVLVVGAAVVYLGRKVFGQDEPAPPPPSFVPMSQLRRSSGGAGPRPAAPPSAPAEPPRA